MNKDIFDYNIPPFNLPNQKLEPTFPYNNMDFDPNLEKNDTTSFKISLLNRADKDIDLYRIKTNPDNIKMRYENFCEINYNSHLIPTNENNISFLGEDFGEIAKRLNKNRKIFKIIKINKKIGRIKSNSTLKGFHNKLSQDNIIRKIKGRFHEKLRLYINTEYRKYFFKKNKNSAKIINWLKKINPKVSRKIKKEENLKWFKSKIYEIFSENVSLRYSLYSPNSNKKKIERLISVNEAKNVIDILNTDIETFYDKYINDEKIEGFKTLKNDIEELKTYMEKTNQEKIKEYLTKYEYTAKNLKKIFRQKNSRNIKSKQDVK
jgi:hypothetical protein